VVWEEALIEFIVDCLDNFKAFHDTREAGPEGIVQKMKNPGSAERDRGWFFFVITAE
jgi:hypothetical protein